MRRLIAALVLALALATGGAPTAGAIPLDPEEITFDSGLKGGGGPIELGPVEDIPDGLKGGG
jgi:hypothetical protein